MIYFTSDLHLRDPSVLNGKRSNDYSCLEEMEEILLDRINSLVLPGDRLVIAGDFCMGSVEEVTDYRWKIRCDTIIFVLGNHDKSIRKNRRYFGESIFRGVYDIYETKELLNGEDKLIIVSHYPFLNWRGKKKNSWSLHGNEHNQLDNSHVLREDVGVDTWEYSPVSIEQIAERMAAKCISI